MIVIALVLITYDGMRRSKARRSLCDGLDRKNGPIAGVMVFQIRLVARPLIDLNCTLSIYRKMHAVSN